MSMWPRSWRVASARCPPCGEISQRGALDPKRPLFLFVNIILAHEPYQPAPRGIAWARQVPFLIELGGKPIDRPLIFRFYTNRLGAAEEGFLRDIHSAYSWGVFEADADLGAILDELANSGWLGTASSLIVTSDHGEMLGEGRQLSHGRTVAPEDLHVFALVKARGFAPGVRVDALTRSQDLFETVRQVAGIPLDAPTRWLRSLTQLDPGRIAVSWSEPDPSWVAATGGVAGHDRLFAAESKEGRATWSSSKGLHDDYGRPDALRILNKLTQRLSLIPLRPSQRDSREIPKTLVDDLRALGYLK